MPIKDNVLKTNRYIFPKNGVLSGAIPRALRKHAIKTDFSGSVVS